MKIKRVDIKTGFLCNNNCFFCVQAHKKKFGNRSTEDIKRDLQAGYKNNCEGVVFTGGEPTIRDDIINLVKHARFLGFKSIQLQTNGRALSYKEFCVKLIKAGANEFAPALHGHNAKLHDYLTRSPGSFAQTTKAIKNLKELGQYVIVNTVVVKPNYRYLPQIAKLVCALDVDQFQFAYVHAMGNAAENIDEMMPRASLAAPYIMKGLQIGINNGKRVMAEAMTPCLMPGYEKYCSELHIPETEIRDLDSFDPNFTKTRKTEGKIKFSWCKKCYYDEICEGPWKEYPEKMGSGEFRPVRQIKKNLKNKTPQKNNIPALINGKKKHRHILGTLQISRRCNQDCIFCSSPHEDSDLSIKEIETRILELKKAGVTEIMITGGEPTLRNDLPRIIKIARSFKFEEVSIQTNGSKLHNKNFLRSCLRAGRLKLSISFHSHRKKIFRKLAGGKSCFEKFVAGVKNVGDLNIPAYFVVVINSLNYRDLKKQIEYSKKTFPFITHFSINFVDPTNNALNNKWIVPKLSDVKPFMLEAFRYIIDSGMSFRIEFVPLCFLDGFKEYSSELRRENFIEPSYAFMLKRDQGKNNNVNNFTTRTNKYFAAPPCMRCSLKKECSWINMGYVKVHGFGELPGF